LLNKLKNQIAEGTDKPCITGNILKDLEAKLNESECSVLGRNTNLTNRQMKLNQYV